MEIKLIQLKIENFKGIKSFEADFGGDNAVIKGANGTGKTTCYDAFLWLLFGKNSEGKKDFKLRPLDENNQPIKGLTLAVEALISLDGTNHVFKKEHLEVVVKGQLRGYETLTWINEVPKKISEYSEYISDIIPEDTFKMLTNLKHFSEGISWKERRAVLLDIAGEIGTPKGFSELMSALNGRTIDEYKKVLSEQKKRHEKEREEINPRLDEIQKGLEAYAGTDTAKLENKRTEIKAGISKLDKKRIELFAQEKQRQEQIEVLNNLKNQKADRERELSNDTFAITGLLEEKAQIEAGIAEKRQAVAEVQNILNTANSKLKNDKCELDSSLKKLNQIRDDYKEVTESKDDEVCYACGQKLPEDKLKQIADKKSARIQELVKSGNDVKADVENRKKSITDYESAVKELSASLKEAQAKVATAEGKKESQFKLIDGSIKSRPAPDFTKDKLWQETCKEITKAEKAIGDPVSKQLEAIEKDKSERLEQLEEINAVLAQADRMLKDQTRIGELEAKEKELAQAIADVEKQLADIDQYQITMSKAIESAVNGKFKHVEFKLFKELLNGGLEECCDATFNGVPYNDMSTGQQIYVGIDIVNVLSAHYGLSVPLFLDHSESLTMPIETESQTIELYAKSNIKKLIIEKKKETANVK